MTTNRRREPWLILTVSLAGIAAMIVALVFLLNPTVTRFVESPQFRTELEKETAKGLHFPTVSFQPIRRIGFLEATSKAVNARGGRKAMTSIDAQGITGRFNPAGVLLRRWQIDDLHVDRAEIGIQIYEPTPEPKPAKPWFAIFLPDRVYLKRVWSDDADVTWPMRGKKGGIFGTRLVVTPHGRDFEYHATKGVLRNPLIPDLAVRKVHLLITKKLFALYELDLASSAGTVRAEGTSATGGDKNLDFKFTWADLPLREWLPQKWAANFRGQSNGDLRWTGKDFKLGSATMTGALQVKNGQVSGLNLLDQIAALTARPDLREVRLTDCEARFRREKSDCEISDIGIEEKNKFRIEGNVSLHDQSLGGTIQLGMARDYLDWLPKPEEVFSRKNNGYLWTTIHLSGTLQAPKQDLSPRILNALKGSPWAFLAAALREFGSWLKSD
ncbi:MAG: hypothetical protein QOH39_2562 [Verrucomicrobiota bacterium]|jgi:hypothetical protein